MRMSIGYLEALVFVHRTVKIRAEKEKVPSSFDTFVQLFEITTNWQCTSLFSPRSSNRNHVTMINESI